LLRKNHSPKEARFGLLWTKKLRNAIMEMHLSYHGYGYEACDSNGFFIYKIDFDNFFLFAKRKIWFFSKNRFSRENPRNLVVFIPS